MTYHRILKIPAGQITIGDVILTYPTSSSDRAITIINTGPPERETVIECHIDPKDGNIYIKTANAAEYCNPWDHIILDCFLTFGKNYGKNR